MCGARYKTRPGLTYHYAHSHKEGASDENSRDSNAPATGPSQPPGSGPPMPSAFPGLQMGGGIVAQPGAVPPPAVAGVPHPMSGVGPSPMLGGQPPIVGGPPLAGVPPTMGVVPPIAPMVAGAPHAEGVPPTHANRPPPSDQGQVYQDSYVSFLNQTPGTAFLYLFYKYTFLFLLFCVFLHACVVGMNCSFSIRQ